MMKPRQLEAAGWETTPWSSNQPPGQLISTTIRAPGVTAASFLLQARGQERFFWQAADGRATFAGFGIAADCRAWGPDRFTAVQAQTEALFQGAIIEDAGQPLAAPRLFGGFSFRDDFVPDNTWAVFHPAQFVLPHFQLVSVGDQSWLTINARSSGDDDPQLILEQLKIALQARYEWFLANSEPRRPAFVEATDIRYPMSFAAWELMLLQALSEMKSGHLDKVVLSRVCELRFPDQVPVEAALAYLNVTYPDCHRFLFEPRPYHAFYGATPEMLARVHGRQLQTMALAGSIRRGQTAAEDQVLAAEIMNSGKDRYEHDVVVQALKRRLAPLTTDLNVPDTPQVLQLGYIQHLYSPVNGRLRERSGILPIVELLHPTPALGGNPRDSAMRFIRRHEPVPRGWYAAPVGWIDSRLNGAFCVAIRSAVTQERRVWLHAGAGIVSESDPQKEWAETDLKFRPMLNALGIEN